MILIKSASIYNESTFTFGGIPHYLNAMLNRLQAKGVEITVVSPKKGNTTIGKGVKMVEGGTYKHLTTPEKKMFYGKSAFPALPEIIAEEKTGYSGSGMALLPASILSARTEKGYEVLQRQAGDS